MATQHVYDMLSVDRAQLSQESSPGVGSAKAPKASKAKKIPKGMSRELFSIMAVDGGLPEMYTSVPSTPPVSDSWRKTIHRDKKRRARHWQMSPFCPSAKLNGPKFLSHWCKAEDAEKEYPFSKLAPHTFAEPLDLPKFSSAEYAHFPMELGEIWTEDSTRHLMDLVSQFDMRFEILQYHWDEEKYGKKDCVDLRARFTDVYNFLLRLRSEKKPLLPTYDAATERKRRLQLNRLQMRTQEEIEEHAALKEQERKIKSNRDERERRQGAIQMRLTDFNARNHSSLEPRNHANRPTGRPSERSQITGQKQKKKAGTVAKPGNKRKSLDPSSITGITAIPEPNLKFPEIKAPGVCARSMRLKLPNSVSSKKAIALKAMLNELGLEEMPMADEESIDEFNKLRNDLILLYELKTAMVNAVTDLSHLKVEIGERASEPQIATLLEKADVALNQGAGEKLISNLVEITPSTSGVRYRRKTTVEQLRTQKNSAGSGTE